MGKIYGENLWGKLMVLFNIAYLDPYPDSPPRRPDPNQIVKKTGSGSGHFFP